MSTPNWSPAVTGATANASQVNQFLGTHSTTFIYQGAQQVANGMNTNSANDYASVGVPSTALATNTGAAAQWLDQPFTTVTSQTTVTRVCLLPFPNGTAADTTISLQTDSSGSPSGTVLASLTFPSDFNTALYTSSASTTYAATSVTDTGGNFPFYGGGSGTSFVPVALIFGWLLVNATDSAFALVTGTGTTATAAVTTSTWTNYTTGVAIATPTSMNGHVYKAYPMVSIPLNATGLTAAVKYHIVIGGTASTSNYNRFADTASVAGEIAQTGTSGSGPWSATTKTLFFGVFANSPGTVKGTALRHTWEDAGARWTGIDYVLTNTVWSAPMPLVVREYTGAMRSERLAVYPSTAGIATGSGLLQSIS